uniref:CSON011626 protein n=1 Tax=Culicoides sonorensis TaxID=179676 RepID=A0A336M7L5_CULSO
MKTRNKTIDVQNLLGISTRSKKVSKKKLPSNNDENKSNVVDVSDKENAQNQRKLASQNRKQRQILSPLKAKSGQELSPVKLKNIVMSPLNVLSIRRTAPEATSTPHPVRRSLFVEYVEEENVPKDPDPIILSDSDCTDTEVDLTVLSDSDCTDVEVQPQRSTDNNTKRVRKKRVEPNPVIKQSKRTIKPTLKALNSPMHRKFFATPRIETCIEDPVSKHVKLNKKGEPVVEVPSRKVFTEAQTKSKRNKKNPDILIEDAKRMPAPVVPVKKTRVKRAVRLYSEPKPVPKNVETVPKYRQELEQQKNVSRTLQRSDSAMGDDDIYNFHPSQEIIEEPQKEDSYIKELIVKLKKRKKPVRRRKNVNRKNHEKEQELVTNEPTVIEIQEEPKNKVDSVMERIRKRFNEKNSRQPESGPRESTNRKSVTFQLENDSLVQDFNQENVPLAHSSVILNRSTNIQNKSVATPEISMMLPPIITPELNNSSRGICDPVPGTSTGGWTTPGQKSKTAQHAKTPHRMTFNRTLSHSVLQSSANRSINSPNSPWRVNEEANVPRTKYFCLSKDLLPSYSSDVIVKDTIPFVPDRNSTAMENNSFHNSSDAENIAPDPVGKSAIVRPMAKRVPLGAIEISDVIRTPEKHHHQPLLQSPLVRHSITNDQIQAQQKRKRPQIEIISNVPVAGQRYRLTGDRLVIESTNKSHDSSNDQSGSGTSDVSDCFGFDISATIDEIPEEEVSQSDLKEKLKRLKHVFPLEKSVSQDVEMPVLFKSPMKQTNTLRDMFDLNVSAKKTKNKESEQKPDEQTNISSDSDSDERVQNISSKDEGTSVTQTESIPIKLFDDPEDVTVKKLPDINRRSYAGRQKRKRVHYSDYETSSSESENDDDDDEGISNKHRHKRKKRAKPDIEKTEEFQEFVNEFNSMCDEVEKYELVIEPIE